MICVIDNYDSFTYNIVQALSRLSNDTVKVFRSKESSISDIENNNPQYLVIGPGPGTPSDAGISIDAIRYFAGKIPILGICLGHQAIAQAFGAKIIGAKYIKHGIVEEINTDGKGLFRIVGRQGLFTRYHSLVIDEKTLPAEFEVTARAKDGDIMGIRHKSLNIEGIQFHPESIASKGGDDLFRAFLNYRRDNLPIADILNHLLSKKDLDEKTAELFMENLTDGTLDERVTSAILTALAAKGPATSEMVGCASVLCHKKRNFPYSNENLAEIVGTGGDGKGSFNISSLSALVAASCGQPMAKHGNRAVSSKSGAADFYEALGIKIDTEPEKTADLIKKTNFCFLMAPIYHSAMKYAGPVRKTLGIKTIMNVLGPLTNPAGAQFEVLGVYDPSLLIPVAHAAIQLGAKRVMTVCSKDGYDEISPVQDTYIYQVDETGKEHSYTLNPQELGITGCTEDELKGGTATDNANLAIDLLSGKGRKTLRAAVALNTAAVLYLAGKVHSLKEGYINALEVLDSGKAKSKLEQVREFSNQL